MKDNFDVHEWNKNRYLSESQNDLEKLASDLSIKHPSLNFEVKFGERIDVRGSQQDLRDFGEEMSGKIFGEYEVFSTNDDDRGEIVQIVKSSSIFRGKPNLTENKGRDEAQKLISKLRSSIFKKLNDDELEEFKKELASAFDMTLN